MKKVADGLWSAASSEDSRLRGLCQVDCLDTQVKITEDMAAVLIWCSKHESSGLLVESIDRCTNGTAASFHEAWVFVRDMQQASEDESAQADGGRDCAGSSEDAVAVPPLCALLMQWTTSRFPKFFASISLLQAGASPVLGATVSQRSTHACMRAFQYR